MADYLFKATNGYKATHGGTYTYRKNRWTRHIDNPVPCKTGWHLARNEQVLNWLAPTLWIAEACPDHDLILDTQYLPKMVTCKVRLVERLDTWNDRTARLFACDCADDALALIENPDPRSVEAVVVARRFANGDATHQELDAAWDTAWAAGDAAWAAARAAARDAGAAAGDAWAAARDAAWAAARAAARDAWAAAGDAARDAWAAAGDAAGDAWAAAGDARAAARDAQYQRLLRYLGL